MFSWSLYNFRLLVQLYLELFLPLLWIFLLLITFVNFIVLSYYCHFFKYLNILIFKKPTTKTRNLNLFYYFFLFFCFNFKKELFIVESLQIWFLVIMVFKFTINSLQLVIKSVKRWDSWWDTLSRSDTLNDLLWLRAVVKRAGW